MNKPFELLEFVFDSVYVDLQYDEICCHGTLCCECRCCGDCDACTVVCVARVCALRM